MTSIAIFIFIILVISIVIHEVSHGYAAYIQGDLTAYYEDRLTLNPLKHVDPIGSVLVPLVTSIMGFPFGWAKPVPFNPYNLRNQRWGEMFVAIAGPGSNIAIAIIFGLIVRFSNMPLTSPFIGFSMIVIWVNLALAVFNLIPIPPLDGSKVLFAFLPYQLQRYRIALEQYSFFLVLILIVLPQFSILFRFIVLNALVLVTGVPASAIGF
jgi:Zn-dependent protease